MHTQCHTDAFATVMDRLRASMAADATREARHSLVGRAAFSPQQSDAVAPFDAAENDDLIWILCDRLLTEIREADALADAEALRDFHDWLGDHYEGHGEPYEGALHD